MTENAQLLIENLFFPTIEVRTLDKHDVNGDRSGTQLHYNQALQKLDGENRYGVVVSVRTDDEKSINPPYRFMLEAYAIFTVSNGGTDELAISNFILDNGTPLVIGAIRERLADLTARSPWGRFLINSIPLTEPRTIRSI